MTGIYRNPDDRSPAAKCLDCGTPQRVGCDCYEDRELEDAFERTREWLADRAERFRVRLYAAGALVTEYVDPDVDANTTPDRGFYEDDLPF